jgi:poly(3-hydroxybutyrate) depolymerase
MGRRRRVAVATLLVAFAWIGACAPLAPGPQAVQLAGGTPAGRHAGPAPGTVTATPTPRSLGLGGGLGLNALAGTEVPISLPGGRAYVIHVPQADDNRPRPLVIAVHGLLLSWQNMAWSTQLSRYADKHGFLVAYAVGIQGWNVGGGCCGPAGRRNQDDVGYLVSVVNDVASRVAVDRSRVYLMGFSAGDILSLYAQCQRPDVFAASAGTGGAQLFRCQSRQPVRALEMHGRGDHTVPFVGGFSPPLNRWVSPTAQFGIRLRRDNPAAVVATQVLNCGHMWPLPDGPCRFDGTAFAWNWVSRFSR